MQMAFVPLSWVYINTYVIIGQLSNRTFQLLDSWVNGHFFFIQLSKLGLLWLLPSDIQNFSAA